MDADSFGQEKLKPVLALSPAHTLAISSKAGGRPAEPSDTWPRRRHRRTRWQCEHVLDRRRRRRSAAAVAGRPPEDDEASHRGSAASKPKEWRPARCLVGPTAHRGKERARARSLSRALPLFFP
ncbi:unnamed protein product, partial [Amoebophrya sp. A120]|eukprot:GSA120T00017645001.1